MRQANPGLTVNQIKQILLDTASEFGAPGNDNDYGYGMIDAYEAVIHTLENYGGTLSGEVTLTENLTIQSGNTLTIAPGTTIKFDSGVKLTINGTLDVKGLFANTVTFDRSGGSDWMALSSTAPAAAAPASHLPLS